MSHRNTRYSGRPLDYTDYNGIYNDPSWQAKYIVKTTDNMIHDINGQLDQKKRKGYHDDLNQYKSDFYQHYGITPEDAQKARKKMIDEKDAKLSARVNNIFLNQDANTTPATFETKETNPYLEFQLEKAANKQKALDEEWAKTNPYKSAALSSLSSVRQGLSSVRQGLSKFSDEYPMSTYISDADENQETAKRQRGGRKTRRKLSTNKNKSKKRSTKRTKKSRKTRR